MGLDNYEPIIFGNPILDLVKPKTPRDREFVLGKIHIAVNIHGIKKIRLYNHIDCGYYKLRDLDYKDKIVEILEIKNHLYEAEKIICDKFSAELDFFLFLIKPTAKERWEKVKV